MQVDRYTPSERIARFEEFEVDVAAHELRTRGRRVKIQDLPFHLLVALLERPAEVVTHEELRPLLWGDTVVDFDAGLHTAVRKLREALGDSVTEPRFIETVPRHGYRFIAEVVRLERERPSSKTIRPTSVLISRRLSYVAGAAVVAAAALLLAKEWSVSDAAGIGVSPQVVPLVSERGILRSPALSPDGGRVAFSWAQEADQSLDLYVQGTDGSARSRLTADSASDRYPAWSPDGSRIAFLRHGQVMLIPSEGGLERVLTTSEVSGVSWSPDGRTVAVADRESPSGPIAIFVVDVESGERRNVSVPQSSALEDRNPSFSPDGKYLAFARSATSVAEIDIVPVEGGVAARVVGPLETGRTLTGLVWSPDGDQLIFAVGRLGLFAVSAAARDAATYQRLDIAGMDVMHPSAVRDPITGQLHVAYGHERYDWDILTSQLVEGQIAPVVALASTRSDDSPAFSPDGRRLAFSSQRSGTPEIWLSNADGTQPRRLTHFDEGGAGTPRWSPDGGSVVFDANIAGNRDIYVIGSDGVQLRRLTETSASDGQPSWSHDGERIYFMSDRSGSRQIWKMPAAGGVAAQLTFDGGYQALESPDGATVYYAKRQQHRGVWSVPAKGGREQLVVESARHNLWAVADDGIYFFDLDDVAPSVFDFSRLCPLKKFEFSTGRLTTVDVIETNLPRGLPAFGLSRDGQSLAWVSRRNSVSELLLIRDVRFQ